MPTRYLSDPELAQLSGYPETIADEDLVTYFRLGEEDLRWLRDGHRGAANRLGLALQLCTREGQWHNLPALGETRLTPTVAARRDNAASEPRASAGVALTSRTTGRTNRDGARHGFTGGGRVKEPHTYLPSDHRRGFIETR